MSSARLVPSAVPCDVCRACPGWLLRVDLVVGEPPTHLCETCRRNVVAELPNPLHPGSALPVLLARPALPWRVDAKDPLFPHCDVERDGTSERDRCLVTMADEATGLSVALHVGEERPWVRSPDYDVVTDLPWAEVRIVVYGEKVRA